MSIQLAVLKKVRCRFLCHSSGSPVSGIVASLSIIIGDSPKLTRIPLGTLCSDTAGYVSFDLKALIDLGVVNAEKLLLASPRVENGEVDLLDILLRASGESTGDTLLSPHLNAINIVGPGSGDLSLCLVFPVVVSDRIGKNDKAATPVCSATSLPAVQSPDVCDYRVSPFSFVTPVNAKLGDGCCEALVPSSLPLQEHRFYKVVVRHEDKNGLSDAPLTHSTAPPLKQRTPMISSVRVTDPLVNRTPELKYAEVIEFKQQWWSLGHSLGEIKYSLALAPGEATQIAIIDWTRQDNISRTDSVFAAEYMDHSLKRDRSIEETIDSALRESQGGSSFMAGTTGQATIPLTYVTLSFNHAIGGSVSNSWGNKTLEADSLQDLHDSIRQQTGYTRSLNSTVVIQASQAEANVLQTRKVANHNHSHALTIQYYEVLRHFLIRTEYVGKKKALLVPFEPFVFSWEQALQFRSILETVLIDQSLKGCFDALFRLKVVPSVYDVKPDAPPAPPPAPPAKTAVTKPSKISKTINVYGVNGEGVASSVTVKSGDSIEITAEGELTMYGGVGGVGAWSKNPNGDTALAAQGSKFIGIGLKKHSLIYKIGVNGEWRQASVLFEGIADSDGEIVFGVNDETGNFADNKGYGNDYWTVTVQVPSHAAPLVVEPDPVNPTVPTVEVTPVASDNIAFDKSKDELCFSKLLYHLNGNQGYYNTCIWVLLNPAERRIRLETALAGNTDLLDALDDTPIAVSGNYLAFPYDGPFPGWQERRPEDPKAKAPLEDIVTLPTRGLFAEAMLGHCNASEERDPTRRWDWNEMTIETLPEIGGITPGPKGESPSITPAPLPGNVIQITQPPSAPDPTGLAAALKVLGTPDIFRNMSGLDEVSKLLETLSKQSSEANIKALALRAMNKLDESKSDAGSTGTAGGSDKTRTSASEPDSAKQVDRLKAIEYAKEKGLINEAQQTEAAQGVLGGEPLPAVQNVSADAGVESVQIAPSVLGDALVGDPAGPLSLSTAVIDHLGSMVSPANGACVEVSASYFAQAMKKIGVPTLAVATNGTPIQMPVIATANGNTLSGRALVTLWFSNADASNWLRLPKRCRGAGAPGALLYADLVENRTILTGNTGWPQGMLPGAHLQLWSTEAEYEDLRDNGVIPGLGHSCVFNDYVAGDATRIIVSDQMGIARAVRYPYFGLKYVMAANLSKARLMTFA